MQALQDEYVAWTAQYLVMKRASIEPNFHPLYSSFLDALDKVALNKRVLLETFRNIKVRFARAACLVFRFGDCYILLQILFLWVFVACTDVSFCRYCYALIKELVTSQIDLC